jgi:Na+-driven multidrug efflux pump
LPTLGLSALQSASGNLDAVWIGRLLGEDALAATANGTIGMVRLLAFVFGMATTILIVHPFFDREGEG